MTSYLGRLRVVSDADEILLLRCAPNAPLIRKEACTLEWDQLMQEKAKDLWSREDMKPDMELADPRLEDRVPGSSYDGNKVIRMQGVLADEPCRDSAPVGLWHFVVRRSLGLVASRSGSYMRAPDSAGPSREVVIWHPSGLSAAIRQSKVFKAAAGGRLPMATVTSGRDLAICLTIHGPSWGRIRPSSQDPAPHLTCQNGLDNSSRTRRDRLSLDPPTACWFGGCR